MDLSDEARERIRTLSVELFDKGRDPKEVLGLTKESLEGLYASAYSFYHGGNHSLAAYFFRLLAYLSPEDPRFYLGIAVCHHQLKQYQEACAFYAIASKFDKENPLPDFYQSDCYIRLDQPKEAIRCLQSAIARSKGKPQYQTLSDRASLTLAKFIA